MITNVYVDGMNLFYGCLKQTPYKWLDLVALSKALLPQAEIRTVRYFTARVSDTPTDPLKSIQQEQYLRALATLPEIQLHFGRFSRGRTRMRVANPPPNTIEVIKNEEIGVVNPHPPNNRTSHLQGDFFRQMRLAALISSQLPNTLKDAAGTFGKPPVWQ